jgi:PD-(D/E)XK nuclease superfamily
MAAMPEIREDAIAQAIYLARESHAETSGRNDHRPHLGASLIGEQCERRLWYTFRWAGREAIDGRMLRLFETGELAEARFVSDLRSIGVEVHDKAPDGSQWRVTAHGGHFGGSMDGAGTNVPGSEGWHVFEFKTHSAKNFSGLVKNGVAKHKPLHLAQTMIYMGLTGMGRALYLACNKDTDELYSEIIDYDQAAFDRLMAKALRVIAASEPPARISEKPDWYECRFCPHKAVCHTDALPEVNCRTCAHSTPVVAGGAPGAWSCAIGGAPVDTTEGQRRGCAGHRYIPILLERTAKPVDYDQTHRDVVYEADDGKRFANGEGPASFSSREIRGFGCKAGLGFAAAIKAQIPGVRLVEAKR